jgi:hypothetical protein
MPLRDPTPEEAKRLASGDCGRELQKAALQYAAPIYWTSTARPNGLDDKIRNGTTFFVAAGAEPFGITAGHVYDAFVDAAIAGSRCQIGTSTRSIDLRERLISRGNDVDIATYRMTAAEIAATGAFVLTGYQSTWPPKPPDIDRGVFYAGFPGIERRISAPWQVEFCALTGSGVANSVSTRSISSVIERDLVVATKGLALPPVGYDLAGMSGGPMLSVVNGQAIMGWRLAGVISDCSRELGEIVVAARADFIRSDGSIIE